MASTRLAGLFLVAVITLQCMQMMQVVQAVDASKFKTCSQAAFCKRLRAQPSNAVPQQHNLYQVITESVHIDASQPHLLKALVRHRPFPQQPPLALTIQLLQHDMIRVQLQEQQSKHTRYHVQDVLLPQAAQPLQHEYIQQGFKLVNNDKENIVKVIFGQNSQFTLQLSVSPAPFTIEVDLHGVQMLSINRNGLLTYEQYRDKKPKPVMTPLEDGSIPEPERPLDFPYDSEGSWEESFGGNTDSKPKGPAAIGVDLTFHGSEHIFGLPEHAASFALKSTIGPDASFNAEPYRLYNLDVFEYELDSPMALYGAIPVVVSHDADKTQGAFWLNAAETFVDVWNGKDQAGNPTKNTHFMSESGAFDLFLMLGPSPSKVASSYATLTGTPALPQLFSLAYHQCRWNYRDEQDVANVDGGFDDNDIPYDVLWLDIEHTDGKRYFTWDKSLFPNPKDMQNKLSAKGRKMVTIIDPHIKRDSGYRVHSEASARSLYVRNQHGSEYEGWCWPGSVSYLDFTNPLVRDYWASQFKYDQYDGATPSLYTWNDMNEPSVFNGPEVTMQKDNLHNHDVEHRDVHNLYGYYQHMSTAQGLVERNEDKNDRPFVLSRAFFAGSQRYGPIWTGDNKASWSHLAVSMPMLLSLNVAGMPFVGADVGGFFGDPDTELLVRWYQAGAYQPFFRGHAHIDAKRREPWLFGETNTGLIRAAVRARYAILPYVYTSFRNSSVTGLPFMKPLWFQYPSETSTFGMEDQYLFGSDLLVKPVTQPGQSQVHVYLPGAQPWYDIDTNVAFVGQQTVTISTPIHKIPVFQRGGSIISRKERVRRSSALMVHDPYTLVIAVDNQSEASGDLYLDDGHSFDYSRKGRFVVRKFSFASSKLTSVVREAGADSVNLANDTKNTIERIVIVGLQKTVSSVRLSQDGQVRDGEITWDQSVRKLVIRKPDLLVARDFTVELL